MAYFIFDLDGTVVDTSHRYRNKPCGNIDLDFWFANSTPEMIAKDALLPLAATWKALYNIGHKIIVCTARDFSDNPLVPTKNIGQVYENFLQDNGLFYHALLHRVLAGPDHETLGDGELKIRLLNDFFRSRGYRGVKQAKAIMYDDNREVIESLSREGVQMYCAIEANARMRGRRAA